MMDTIHITALQPYDQTELCIATVDINGLNKIVIDPVFDAGIAQYDIYKNENVLVATLTMDSIQNMGIARAYDFITDPGQQASRYSVKVTDTCGNVSDFSVAHTTIWASAVYDVNSNIVLTRSDYIVSDGSFNVGNYVVLIDSLSDGNLTVINTFQIGNHNFTVMNPLAGASYYVGAELPYSCDGTGGIKSDNLDGISVSNRISTNTNVAKYERNPSVNVYPNPSSGIFRIDGPISSIEVFDNLGRLILSSSNNNTINLTSFGQGIYHAKIQTANGPATIKLVVK
jgi:hypothetical protein